MKLWTIRRANELDELERNGVLRTSSSKADADLRTAYDWMAEQMKARIGSPPEGVDYPIWVWRYFQGFQRMRPDLRARCLLPRGTQGIRVELEIPDEKVLLSDFDSWHSVLNNHHYSTGDDEYQEIEDLILRKGLNHPEVERLKRESWQRIFDLSLIADLSNTSIQGVVWEVPVDYIKKIGHFIAR
jgi:hypothetical protein